ncbi:D-alanyl-D-alanine carboxypeptidase [Aliiroseovarius halocynthiae]|uniref:D-alanyl-D-alanine carboxypeptidase n=1 Tax=Aliiroseovarius halocynthiae TaxID=985055 RepID=A0A545SZP4_9RHOB|nr:D-alanyl-D-alanine carboxypeptidase family protein [Aliiroseovarius halocynthiae]TQV70420.1 D-alanyl-D-alanine carboxypeptidase [Aliiroseovarius halocynthiae]SMR81864.1 D-alanyl-D-alanine carboxypeptidase [Aliiroseovarius halocynthiae]
MTRLKQLAHFGLFLAVIGCLTVLAPARAQAAPYAAMVIDARTGKVLHARNADTRLHPASLTKMMTLYVAFEAIKHGEISADTVVTITGKASAEPPSKLGLRKGQKIKMRYLIRAAAVKSANDAATAIGIAISGSEAAFARRMNRTAKALGMTRTHFKNAHGLTESGHLSTARDMTTLGRHLFYDHPEYYNLFSRRSTHAGIKSVNNTNRRFLNSYKGADGIKTGFTNAAGFNLVASAERGQERIITTVFGGRSTASRNAKVAELMDLGFRRAPSRASVRKPTPPLYAGNVGGVSPAEPIEPGAAGKTIRLITAVKRSPRPAPRPVAAEEPVVDTQLASLTDSIKDAVAAAVSEETPTAPEAEAVALAPAIETTPVPAPAPAQPFGGEAAVTTAAMASPPPRPATIILASLDPADDPATAAPEIVTRMSTSGGRHYAINVGVLGTRYHAERRLLKTALREIDTLDEALRKVVKRSDGWHANFVSLTQEQADLACRRLNARNTRCKVLGPS